MSAAFRRSHAGAEARLSPAEVALLRDLAEQLRQLYAEPVAGDAVLERLFPDGRRDDPQAAAELRALTEEDLRAAKGAAVEQLLGSLADSGGRIRLTEEEAELWLRALTDLRLTLAIRLDITTPEDADRIDREDPESYPWVVYEWLGWLQESLVEAVAGW